MAISVGELEGVLKLNDQMTAALKRAADDPSFAKIEKNFATINNENWAGISASLSKFGSSAKSVGMGLTAGLTLPIALAGGAAIKMGMDAIESESLVSVSFGDMKDSADVWSKGLSKNLGLNQFELRKTSGVLFNMTESMGLSREAAFEMSTGVVELAADMSSFRDIPMEEALNKIKSGLVGEAEPLKAIGILVNDATIKTYAYSHGIAEQGKELNDQQKILARYGAIMEATKNDQGDLARTIESPTNQLRIMGARVAEASTQLGMVLMPVVGKVIGVLAGLVEKLQVSIAWFGQLSPKIQTAAVIGVAFLAALGPVVYVLGSLASAAAALTPVLAFMGISAAGTSAAFASLWATMVPLLLPLAAVAAAAYLVYTTLDHFGLLDPVLSFLSDLGTILSGIVVGAFKLAWMISVEFWKFLSSILGPGLSWLGEKFYKMAKVVYEYVLPGFQKVGEWTKKLAGWFGATSEEVKTMAEQTEGLVAPTKDLAGATEDAATVLAKEAEALKISSDAAAKNAASVKAAADAQKKLAEELKKVVDQLTGRSAAAEMQKLSAQVTAAGGAAKITAFEKQKLGKQIQELVAQGASLTPVLFSIFQEQERLSPSTMKLVGAYDGLFMAMGAISSMKFVLPPPPLPMNIPLNVQTPQEIIEMVNRQLARAGQYAGGGALNPDPFAVPFGKAMKGSIGRALEGLGSVVVGAIQGGGDVGKALGASIGGSLGTDLGKAIASTIGGTVGKTLGSFAGPLGAIAGSMIGGVIGNLFGQSQGMKDLLAANKEIGKYRAKLLEVYGSLKDIAALDAALGTEVAWGWHRQGKEGLAAFDKSAQELEKRLAAVRDEMSRITKEGGDASAELIRFRDAMPLNPDVQEFVLAQINVALGHVKDYITTSRILTQEGASAMSSILLAAWDGTASGLRDLLPTIALMQTRLTEAGFAGGEAFDHITVLAGIASDEITGPMISAMESAAGALTAMNNAGFLTQEVFSGLVGEIMGQRDALLATGATSQNVNALMQSELQRIWELTKDGTYAVDEKTQALLDEAEAAGQVGDRFRSSQDRMVAALERIADMFQTVFADKLTSAIEEGAANATRILDNLPTDIDIDVRIRPYVVDGGSDGYDREPRGYARGGAILGVDTINARLSPGEGVLSPRGMSALGDLNNGTQQTAATSDGALGREMKGLREDLTRFMRRQSEKDKTLPASIGRAVRDAVLIGG